MSYHIANWIVYSPGAGMMLKFVRLNFLFCKNRVFFRHRFTCLIKYSQPENKKSNIFWYVQFSLQVCMRIQFDVELERRYIFSDWTIYFLWITAHTNNENVIEFIIAQHMRYETKLIIFNEFASMKTTDFVRLFYRSDIIKGD